MDVVWSVIWFLVLFMNVCAGRYVATVVVG